MEDKTVRYNPKSPWNGSGVLVSTMSPRQITLNHVNDETGETESFSIWPTYPPMLVPFSALQSDFAQALIKTGDLKAYAL
ncbi:MAG: hypothetical protein ACRC1W_17175 [Shewanella sp.]